MNHYRIYFLDARNRINGVEEGDFENDELALERAHALLTSHRAVELWTGTRWVDHLMQRGAWAPPAPATGEAGKARLAVE